MRVASFHAIESSIGKPKDKAWSKLETWAKSANLLTKPQFHHIFGFTNPAPRYNKQRSKWEGAHGYEFCITIPHDFPVEEDTRTKIIEGGVFAVVRCNVEEKSGESGETWKTLFRWIKKKRTLELHPHCTELKRHYDPDQLEFGKTCFEFHLIPPTSEENTSLLDLYAPIKQKKDSLPL